MWMVLWEEMFVQEGEDLVDEFTMLSSSALKVRR